METASQVPRQLDVLSSKGAYAVIASLPKNATSLAVQAEEAGVDAVMMNIDGEEGSHPSHFGSYDLHDAYINDVVSTLRVPCGIFIGGGRAITEEYWERVMSSRFSFVDMYAHQMPLFILSDERLKRLTAVSTGYILEQVKQLSHTDGVEAIDVATVSPLARGSPFTALDFSTVGVICSLSARPVLLRTQKKLTRGDIARVVAQGVRGLIVDPSILSGTDETYKDELSRLGPVLQDAEPQ